MNPIYNMCDYMLFVAHRRNEIELLTFTHRELLLLLPVGFSGLTYFLRLKRIGLCL